MFLQNIFQDITKIKAELMARPIKNTPPSGDEDAIEVLKEMQNPHTKKR